MSHAAEPDVGGYSAPIPALPGCHTQGETLDEVRPNLREAAEGWLAVAQAPWLLTSCVALSEGPPCD
jgi:predicted RNase H-like HicB family nuclease